MTASVFNFLQYLQQFQRRDVRDGPLAESRENVQLQPPQHGGCVFIGPFGFLPIFTNSRAVASNEFSVASRVLRLRILTLGGRVLPRLQQLPRRIATVACLLEGDRWECTQGEGLLLAAEAEFVAPPARAVRIDQ